MKGESMNFEEWMKLVPGEIIGDSLWKMEAYRLRLFTQIVCLLLRMAPDQGAFSSFLKDDSPEYGSNPNQVLLEGPLKPEELFRWLQDVSMP